MNGLDFFHDGVDLCHVYNVLRMMKPRIFEKGIIVGHESLQEFFEETLHQIGSLKMFFAFDSEGVHPKI